MKYKTELTENYVNMKELQRTKVVREELRKL